MIDIEQAVGFVVIGRNEGDRLKACIRSILYEAPQSKICYVDSGSVDDSIEFALKSGCAVEKLDLSTPFTAARARNEGWKHIQTHYQNIKFIHFIDGDCELVPGWVAAALGFLYDHLEYGVICGRRVERFPKRSIYNRLCDIEWDTPVGDADACGGDAIIRLAALDDVRGYSEKFIAGEEPEMCLRLRSKGWKVRRIGRDMTVHDANITQFSQWWKRNKRGGYAYALGYLEHGKKHENYKKAEVRRIVLWGVVLPFLIVVLSLKSGYFLWLFLLYPVQVLRLGLRQHKKLKNFSFVWALYNMVGKFAEANGVLSCFINHRLKRNQKIIEYK